MIIPDDAIFGAPIAGITDKPFRKIVRQFGDHFLFTEMISAKMLLDNHEKTMKMADISGEKNVIVQLLGTDPAQMALAAKMMQDAGAAGIDINMGCPSHSVCAGGAGAALMQNQDLAVQLVRKMKEAVDIPVSVKMRLGWDYENRNALEFSIALSKAGVDRLAIHARTREQEYSGRVDWAFVKQITDRVETFILLNGDISDRLTAEMSLQQSWAEGVMVGRAMMGRPWVLQEIETNRRPQVNLNDLIQTHFDDVLTYHGHGGLLMMRKHLASYCVGKRNGNAWRDKVVTEDNPETVKRMISDFFG